LYNLAVPDTTIVPEVPVEYPTLSPIILFAGTINV
jgi:hypothetical protein